MASETETTSTVSGLAGIEMSNADGCCVSPCEPAWQTGEQCMFVYDTREFLVPEQVGEGITTREMKAPPRPVRGWDIRIVYQHRICRIGKQQGPLLYTVTLLPREKVTLYESERYRLVTSEQDRFSVQTTFMRYVSAIHGARQTGAVDLTTASASSSSSGISVSVGGGLGGLIPSVSISHASSESDYRKLDVNFVSDQFYQSAIQASQMTHAERSVVISRYEETDKQSSTARVLENFNDCRAVTYFVRQIVESYYVITSVFDVYWKVAGEGGTDWRSAGEADGETPHVVLDAHKRLTSTQEVKKPIPITIPTDGVVYDPELAHCSSCEPEREAALLIELRKQAAEARALELEVQRRAKLLEKGDLGPFAAIAQATSPALGGSSPTALEAPRPN